MDSFLNSIKPNNEHQGTSLSPSRTKRCGTRCRFGGKKARRGRPALREQMRKNKGEQNAVDVKLYKSQKKDRTLVSKERLLSDKPHFPALGAGGLEGYNTARLAPNRKKKDEPDKTHLVPLHYLRCSSKNSHRLLRG